MYAWIFRHLPGPTWFKVIESLILIGAAVAALFTWVYPLGPVLPGAGTVLRRRRLNRSLWEGTRPGPPRPRAVSTGVWLRS